MDDLKSRYSVFLENYDRGNKHFNAIYNLFIESIKVDISTIIDEVKDETLQKKLTPISKQLDQERDYYHGTILIGVILSECVIDLFQLGDERVKTCVLNITLAYLNLSKETQDQHILNITLRLVENINSAQQLQTA